MYSILKKITSTLMILTPFFLSAQQAEVEDVFSVELRNKGAITSESEVTGYFMFYKKDEVDEDVFDYELLVLDQNLNKLLTKKIEGNDQLILTDCVYNGKELYIQLLDLEKGESISKRYNQSTNEISSRINKLSQYDLMVAKANVAQSSPSDLQQIFPLNNTGFLNYKSISSGRKFRPQIDFVSSVKGRNDWSYEMTGKQKKDMIFAGYLYSDENVIINSLVKMDMSTMNNLDKNFDSHILALDSKNGGELFEANIDNDENNFQVRSAHFDKEEQITTLYGVYFNQDEGFIEGSGSLGVFVMTLNKKGKELTRTLLSWEEVINPKIENAKNKLDENTFAQIHDIKKIADGRTFIIAEQLEVEEDKGSDFYKVGDLFIMELNKDDDLDKVEVIEKIKTQNSSDSLDIITDKSINRQENRKIRRKLDKNMNLKMNMMYSSNQWDFELSYLRADQSELAILYTSLIDAEDTKEYSVGSVTISGENYDVNRFEIEGSTEKENFSVLRAKSGNVCVFQYLPEEKRVKWTLEKIE